METKIPLSKRKAKRQIKPDKNNEIEAAPSPKTKIPSKRGIKFYLFIVAMLVFNGFTYSYWLTNIFDDDAPKNPNTQAKNLPSPNKKAKNELPPDWDLPPQNAPIDRGYNASSGQFPPGALPSGVNLPGITSYNPTMPGRTMQQGYGANDGIRQQFVGYERDNETELDFAQNRYYNPKHGRFTSPDEPFADQDVNNPQSWNLYSYVRNNPLNLTDPLGRAAGCPENFPDCVEKDGKYYIYVNKEYIEIVPGVEKVVTDVPRDGGGPNLTVEEAMQQQRERRERFVWNNIFSLAGYGIGKLFGNIGGLFSGKSPTPTTTTTITTTTTTTTATAPMSIPQKVRNILSQIKNSGGKPPTGFKGGKTFRNDGRAGGQILPKTDGAGNSIKYTEYDVNSYQRGVNRGTERLVTGSDGSAYYTGDHYRTCLQLKP